MLHEGTAFARKIIDFYSCRGIECSVVDEHLSLLVMLSLDGRTHEFRCSRRELGSSGTGKNFHRTLERECAGLKAPDGAAAERRSGRDRRRPPDEEEDE